MNAATTNMLVSQAVALQKQGKFNESESLFRQVLRQDPNHAAATHYLGIALYQQGYHKEAETYIQRSIEKEPNNAAFLGNYAQYLVATDQPLPAVPIYQRWLALEPDNPLAWHQLGIALGRMGGLDPASECCRCALAINPEFMPARIALADYQRAAYLREEAESGYRQVMQKMPGDVGLYCKLAALLTEMLRYDEALELLDNAAGFAPQDPHVYCQRGITLSVCGKLQEAELALRRALSLAPDFYEACVHLVGIKKLGLDDPLFQQLQKAAAEPATIRDAGLQVNVQFSMARILQDNGEYQRAFTCFTASKKARRLLIPYSHSAQAASINAIRDLFDADYIQRMRVTSSNSDIPIFIIGMPRSGTTLLEQCLARHPQVRAGGEMVLLHAALRRRLHDRYRSDLAGGLREMDAADYQKLSQSLLVALQPQLGNARHITDKMPSNFALAGLLHVLFPNAAIIHCQRNALDTCVSCYTTLFRSAHGFADNQQDLGGYYRLYLDMMEHWRQVLPENRFYELHYEALVSNPEAEIRRLLAFLNVPWHPDCLNFGATGPVHTASVAQVRRPLYQSSIGRWRNYQMQLSELQEALGDMGEVNHKI